MLTLDVYRTLADESRLRLLHVLSSGRFNVQELTSILELSQSTISHHLKVLQSCGLATVEREGTWAYYSLAEHGETDVPSLIAANFLEIAKSAQDRELQRVLSSDRKRIETVLAQRREMARSFFDRVAPSWRDLREDAGGRVEYLDALIKELDPGDRLLELGCGSGALFERILPRKGKTIGVDYSEQMLEQARSHLGSRASSVDLRLGYLEHLPLGDESVDTVVSHMVMHHIPHPLEALKDALRVLRSEGRLLILDLTAHQNELMRERFADLWLGFDPAQFKRWVKQAGFAGAHVKLLGAKKDAFILTAVKP